MQEYNIHIEIDEDGNIKAETKGMKGKVCASELDDILKNIDGKTKITDKPEYYDKNNTVSKKVNINF